MIKLTKQIKNVQAQGSKLLNKHTNRKISNKRKLSSLSPSRSLSSVDSPKSALKRHDTEINNSPVKVKLLRLITNRESISLSNNKAIEDSPSFFKISKKFARNSVLYDVSQNLISLNNVNLLSKSNRSLPKSRDHNKNNSRDSKSIKEIKEIKDGKDQNVKLKEGKSHPIKLNFGGNLGYYNDISSTRNKNDLNINSINTSKNTSNRFVNNKQQQFQNNNKYSSLALKNKTRLPNINELSFNKFSNDNIAKLKSPKLRLLKSIKNNIQDNSIEINSPSNNQIIKTKPSLSSKAQNLLLKSKTVSFLNNDTIINIKSKPKISQFAKLTPITTTHKNNSKQTQAIYKKERPIPIENIFITDFNAENQNEDTLEDDEGLVFII